MTQVPDVGSMEFVSVAEATTIEFDPPVRGFMCIALTDSRTLSSVTKREAGPGSIRWSKEFRFDGD